MWNTRASGVGATAPHPWLCRSLAASAIAVVSMVAFTNTALADGSLSISGSMQGAAKASPGDWISAGYQFTTPGLHAPASVTFVHAQVVVAYFCDANPGIRGAITIPLSGGPYSDPRNSSSWFPSGNNQRVAAGYQGAAKAPDACGGGFLNLSNGATFTADAKSTSRDKIGVRFHYNDAATSGAHSNINCSSTSDNPNPEGVGACSSGWSETASLRCDPVSGVSAMPQFGRWIFVGLPLLLLGGGGTYAWRRRRSRSTTSAL